MISIFRAIGLAATITALMWPALTSPAIMDRHYEQQCRQKRLYVALTDCERMRAGHVQTAN